MTTPEEAADESLAPDDAFRLLGNETRIEILQVLWEARDPEDPSDGLAFSALFDRVDIADPGNFNYHLGELTPHFVRETDVGYALTAPGVKVVQAIIAGGPTTDPTRGPDPVDVSCVRCESPVELSYEDGITWVRCTACEGFWPQRDGEILGFGLPPQGLRGRGPDAVLAATLVYTLHRLEAMSDGICPECGGVVAASLRVCEDHEAGDGVCESCGFHFLGILHYRCSSCKNTFRAPSWAPIHRHPAVVSFYYDHGVEHVHNSWASVRRGFGWGERLQSVAPPRVDIVIEQGDEELVVTLDESGDVVGVERAAV